MKKFHSSFAHFEKSEYDFLIFRYFLLYDRKKKKRRKETWLLQIPRDVRPVLALDQLPDDVIGFLRFIIDHFLKNVLIRRRT